MKSSHILKSVYIVVKNNRYIYICHALSDLGRGMCEENKVKIDKLREWIEGQLLMTHSMESYLHRYFNIPLETVFEHSKKVQEARLAWIENMIQICEHEND